MWCLACVGWIWHLGTKFWYLLFLAANFPSVNPGGSQERISLITNSLILLSYSKSIIKGTEILALFYIFLFYDRPFLHVCNLEENILFRCNSWLSFQRLCRLLWGYLYISKQYKIQLGTQLLWNADIYALCRMALFSVTPKCPKPPRFWYFISPFDIFIVGGDREFMFGR